MDKTYFNTFICMHFSYVPKKFQQIIFESIEKKKPANVQYLFILMKRFQEYIYDEPFRLSIKKMLMDNIGIFYFPLIAAHNYVLLIDQEKQSLVEHLDKYLETPFNIDYLADVYYFIKRSADTSAKNRINVLHYVKNVIPALKEKYGDNFQPKIRYDDLNEEDLQTVKNLLKDERF